MTYMPIHLILNDYFPEKFVLANTVALYGYTAGSMLLPILMEKSLQAYGYHGAFLILGGVAYHSAVCASTIRKVSTKSTSGEGQDYIEQNDRKCVSGGRPLTEDTSLHGRKEGKDEDGDEENQGVSDQTRLIRADSIKKQELSSTSQSRCTATLFQAFKGSCGIWKEPIFAFSIPIQILQSYTCYAWMLFLVPHTEQLGIPSSTAVYLSTIGGIGGIIGRTVFIVFLSKGVNAFAVYIPVGCVCTATFLLDFVSSDYRSRAAFAFFQGFSFFIEDAIGGSLCKDAVFDDTHSGMAFANAAFWCGVGATFAGTFTGYLFDITQSFTKVFIIIGLIHAFMVGHLSIVAILIKRKR
nr:uncharacterized protein LOC129274418 [Lytechinus pictus]